MTTDQERLYRDLKIGFRTRQQKGDLAELLVLLEEGREPFTCANA